MPRKMRRDRRQSLAPGRAGIRVRAVRPPLGSTVVVRQARGTLRRTIRLTGEHRGDSGSSGRLDAAFDWLQKALAEKSWLIAWLHADPLFDPIRLDPRFEDLLAQRRW